jgi:hypothetical protein
MLDYRRHVRALNHLLAFHPHGDQFIKALRRVRLNTQHRTRVGLGLAQPRD